MTERVIIYARVSGDDRQNSSSSLESQIEQCREFAQSQGWEIIAELAEDSRGASGAKMNLPMLDEAFHLAREEKFDILLSREMDRIARNLAKQLVVEEEFKRLGIKMEYVIGDYQDTLEGQLSKQIRAVIAEYEREKIKERMVRGRRRKAKSGYVVIHGNVLYGYKVVNDGVGDLLEIDEESAAVVRMIFDLYVNQKFGSPKIVYELGRLGISPPSGHRIRGNRKKAIGWNQSQVIRIISNEAYTGKWQYGKRNRKQYHTDDYKIEVEIPAIISKEIFDQAQALRKSNRKTAKRNTKREYLLARRCYCGLCHSSMSAYTRADRKTNYPYYRCPVPSARASYLYYSCSQTKSFRADYWDDRVWQEIKKFLSNPDKLSAGIRQYQEDKENEFRPIQERFELLSQLLEKKNQEYKRLLDLYLSGNFDQSFLEDKKYSLEEEIKALETELEEFGSQKNESISEEEIFELEEFSRQISLGLIHAEQDFGTRRQLIELLGIKVYFKVEDGNQVAYVYCDLGRNSKLLFGTAEVTQISSHPLESGRLASSHGVEGGNCSSIDKHSMDCTRN